MIARFSLRDITLCASTIEKITQGIVFRVLLDITRSPFRDRFRVLRGTISLVPA